MRGDLNKVLRDFLKKGFQEDIVMYAMIKGRIFRITRNMDEEIISELLLMVDYSSTIEDIGFLLNDSCLSLKKCFGKQIVCNVDDIQPLTANELPNTMINYRYCNSENVIVHNSVVIPGHMTPEMISQCMSACINGKFFIPHEVGLPETKPDDEAENDISWFEIKNSDFLSTFQSVTVNSISAEKLIEKFKKMNTKRV